MSDIKADYDPELKDIWVNIYGHIYPLDFHQFIELFSALISAADEAGWPTSINFDEDEAALQMYISQAEGHRGA